METFHKCGLYQALYRMRPATNGCFVCGSKDFTVVQADEKGVEVRQEPEPVVEEKRIKCREWL